MCKFYWLNLDITAVLASRQREEDTLEGLQERAQNLPAVRAVCLLVHLNWIMKHTSARCAWGFP